MNRYLSGLLTEKQNAEFERHLALCPDCQARVKQQKELEVTLRGFGQLTQPSVEKVDEAVTAIMAQIKQPERVKEAVKHSKPLWTEWFDFSRPMVLGPALAGILLVIVASWMVLRPASLSPVKIARLVGDSLEVQSSGESGQHTLNRGGKLKAGDQIKTGPGTRLALLLGNSGEIWLEQNSKLKVLPGTGNALELESGKLWVVLDKKQPRPFRVKTPSGIVTALGTEFVIQILPDDKMMVACMRHSVAVKNDKGSVVVPSGQKTYTSSQAAPHSPMPLSGFEDWRKAIDLYGQMSPEELHKLGNEYMKKGSDSWNQQKYNESWNYYGLVAYLYPKTSRAYRGMGYSSLGNGTYDKAVNEFENAYFSDSGDIDTLFMLSYSLIEIKNYTRAYQISKNLRELKQDSPSSWILLGLSDLGQNNINDAKKSFIHAVNLNKPINNRMKDHLHAGLAEIARVQKNYELVEKELSAINFEKTQEGYPFVVAARYYQDTGKPRSEMKAWQGYLVRRPDAGFSEEARERIRTIKKEMDQGI